jgi:hypothetical protein
MLHFLSDNYFFTFSCRAPSLMRGHVFNLQCNDANSISSYIATDGLSASSSWCRAPTRFYFFVWQLLSFRCKASSPISPTTRVIQPEIKVKVTLVLSEIFNFTIGRAAWESCSATWNLVPTEHLPWNQGKS